MLDFKYDPENMSGIRKKKAKKITAAEFDALFERGEDITPYMDFDNAEVFIVKRVNVDFPSWMVKRLDQEARKLNISRQAVIKMWIHDRLVPQHRISSIPHRSK